MSKVQLDQDSKNRLRLIADLLRELIQPSDNTVTVQGQVNAKLSSFSRIPGFTRSTGIGSIQSDTYSFSVANVGGADGTLLGETIKDGEVVSFDAGSLNNFYPAASITWDATGTEFIVTYNI